MSRGALFYLLRNRLYLGEIPHRDATYPGQHAAIVDQNLFDAVQAKLATNTRRRRKSRERTAASPLTGRIFDTDGQPMSPTFAYGRNRRLYRYYVSAELQQGRPHAAHGVRALAPRRVSGAVLEKLLEQTMLRLLPDHTSDTMSLISRVEVHRAHLDLTLPIQQLRTIRRHLGVGETAEADPADPAAMRLTLPARLRIFAGKSEIIAGAPDAPKPDPVLIKALRNAHAMLEVTANGAPTLAAAPASPYLRRLVRLAFLAPDLQRAILHGRQPRDMTLAALMEADIPLAWSEQRSRLGAPSPS